MGPLGSCPGPHDYMGPLGSCPGPHDYMGPLGSCPGPHDYMGLWKLYKDDKNDGDDDPFADLDVSEV